MKRHSAGRMTVLRPAHAGQIYQQAGVVRNAVREKKISKWLKFDHHRPGRRFQLVSVAKEYSNQVVSYCFFNESGITFTYNINRANQSRAARGTCFSKTLALEKTFAVCRVDGSRCNKRWLNNVSRPFRKRAS